VAITLASDGSPAIVTELAVALEGMSDPTLGSVDGDTFTLIGDADWSYFAPGQSSPPEGREVPMIALI